jgi:predicted ATP-dependent serine protease
MYGIKKAFDWVEAFEKRGLSWTIPTWVPEGAVVLLAGAAGSGKSFLGLQAALGLAGGGSAWGETVEPKGKVLYLGADTNPHMFGQRLALLSKGLSEEQLARVKENLYVNLDSGNLNTDKNFWMEILEVKARLIVVDCLVRYLRNNLDTDSARISPVFTYFRAYAGKGSSVIVLHHFNKSSRTGADRQSLARQIRGSSDLIASVDVAYGLEGDGQQGLLRMVKNRVEQEKNLGLRFRFGEQGLEAFEKVDFGQEEAGLAERNLENLKAVLSEQAGLWMSRLGLCRVLGEQEDLPGERTLDKAFARLGKMEGVKTMWGKRGERLYRVG